MITYQGLCVFSLPFIYMNRLRSRSERLLKRVVAGRYLTGRESSSAVRRRSDQVTQDLETFLRELQLVDLPVVVVGPLKVVESFPDRALQLGEEAVTELFVM